MNKKKVFNNIEPLYTFLGHRGMVTAVGIKGKSGRCFTAGVDSKVIVWQCPPLNQDAYDTFGRCGLFRQATLDHPEAAWDIAVHPADNIHVLFSACADGKTYAFRSDASSTSPLLAVQHPETKTGAVTAVPSSLALLQTDPSKLMVAYTNGHLALVDGETGQVIRLLADSTPSGTDGGGSSSKRTTKVCTHPTLGLALTGHVDHSIRFWDVKQGACVNALKAHRDVVTSVSVDQTGLYLVSGGHDQSVRFWDLTTQKIVQDLDPHQTHRSKYDEAVHTVMFHPAYDCVASGGADSVIKIYS